MAQPKPMRKFEVSFRDKKTGIYITEYVTALSETHAKVFMRTIYGLVKYDVKECVQ